jgi:hypothetical protein
MSLFWSKLETLKDRDESLNEKLITDLVNIDAEITVVNKILKSNIKKMYDNCMK